MANIFFVQEAFSRDVKAGKRFSVYEAESATISQDEDGKLVAAYDSPVVREVVLDPAGTMKERPTKVELGCERGTLKFQKGPEEGVFSDELRSECMFHATALLDEAYALVLALALKKELIRVYEKDNFLKSFRELG